MAFSIGTEVGKTSSTEDKEDEEDEEDEEYSEAFSPALLPILARPLWLVRNGAVKQQGPPRDEGLQPINRLPMLS